MLTTWAFLHLHFSINALSLLNLKYCTRWRFLKSTTFYCLYLINVKYSGKTEKVTGRWNIFYPPWQEFRCPANELTFPCVWGTWYCEEPFGDWLLVFLVVVALLITGHNLKFLNLMRCGLDRNKGFLQEKPSCWSRGPHETNPHVARISQESLQSALKAINKFQRRC